VTAPRRRPLDQFSPTTRFVIAVVGLFVGLGLIFVGARSCETSLEDDPTPVIVTEVQPGPN
jgi:hypothetical protein